MPWGGRHILHSGASSQMEKVRSQPTRVGSVRNHLDPPRPGESKCSMQESFGPSQVEKIVDIYAVQLFTFERKHCSLNVSIVDVDRGKTWHRDPRKDSSSLRNRKWTISEVADHTSCAPPIDDSKTSLLVFFHSFHFHHQKMSETGEHTILCFLRTREQVFYL